MSAVISWNTHKIEGGFRYQVYEIAYGVPTKILREGTMPTRSRAVSQAKGWTKFCKELYRREAASGQPHPARELLSEERAA